MPLTKRTRELEQAAILFCGDSGDGMQLTGTQFSNTSAVFGNDVCTLPDYPSEIRAPAGSLAGVSAFQVGLSSHEIYTPGDDPDVLVAMNPAALKVNLRRLRRGGVLIVDRDAFTKGNLKKAGYEKNPLEDPELVGSYELQAVPISSLVLNALADVELDKRSKTRCKNFLALGLLFWLYDRPLDTTLAWIASKFARAPAIAEANKRALEAGHAYGETSEAFSSRYSIPERRLEPGTYRIISGNEASALGFVTAARLAGKPLVYSSYPITPATDVLHHLSRLKRFDVRTLQVEDEIAAMGSAIGAAFGGAFSVTGTSGPGVCLKSEAINLALMLELPVVILNVQRGGPSTGLPTKTEQTDLLQAVSGRNGESPIPILAPATAADCFAISIEAFRMAVRHSTPVFILSEGYLGNGSEPWHIPRFADLEPIEVEHLTDPEGFQPYMRDEKTLGRPWVLPGTKNMQHRIGGLEKDFDTGDVSHDPQNHERMCRIRAEKFARVAEHYPELEVDGPERGKSLILSWGGTYGAVRTAVQRLRAAGRTLSHAHLRLVQPFPRNLGSILAGFDQVLVPELNSGQLAQLVRAAYLVDVQTYGKIQGLPFTISELERRFEEFVA